MEPNAIEFPETPPADFKKWLIDAGWKTGFGHYRTCPVCHRIADGDLYFGWDSPGYRFYHQGCLMKAVQVRQQYRRFLRSQQQEARAQ